MPVELAYQTHTLTEDNESGIATGWLPGKLSAEGQLLAVELGLRRRDDGVCAVFVSDLARAVETARIAFDGSGIRVFEDARLCECNYGELNGAPVSLLAAERAKRIDSPFPGGQSYRGVLALTESFLRDLLAERGGQRVLVISHSANKWALDCLLKGALLENLVDAPFGWQEGWLYRVE